MTADQLRKSILQQAIQGKLVPQDPNDEPASALLERIREEKARLVEEKKIKKEKNPSVIFRGEDNSYYEKFTLSGEVKCIDEEIPFEIPNGWEWSKISKIAFVTKLAGFEYTEYIARNLSTTGIPLFKGKNIQKGKIIYDFEGYIPEKISDFLERSQIIKKCLLTPYVGTIGNIGVHNKEGKFHLGSNVGKIEFFRPNSNICVLEEFAQIYLQSIYGYQELTKYKKATAQESISIDAIREVYFPLPPLKEQQRIVEKIEELIPHIEHYSKAQAELDLLNKNIKEQLKKSVLQYAIEGKLVPQDEAEGTAEVLLEQIQKEKQKLYEENKLKKKDLEHSTIFKGEDNKYYEKIGKNITCIDEEIPFETPKNWRWCRVSNISQSYIGLTYRPEEIKKEGVIVLRSSNIKDGKIVLQDIVRVSKEIPDKLLVKENDIIICARNGSQKLVGKSALIEKIVEPTTFGAFMAICKTPFYKYMYLFLQSNCFFSQLKNVSGTTTINQLTQSSLNNFLIPLPPLAEQQRIVESIDAIFRCIEN